MAKKGTPEVAAGPGSPKDDRKDTCRLSFKASDGLNKAMGDLELDETITFTVTGKVTSLDMSQHNGPYDDYESSSLEVEINSIKGTTSAAEKNKNELDDMTNEKE